MNAAEVAAYVGAAAWLPQITTWLYQRYVRPIVMIVPEREVQLGFTSYGPIFNVRVALSADSKDAILDRMTVVLRHEDGGTREFTWTGIQETFSEIRDDAGNRQRIEKDQPAIAIKVSTVLLQEKFIRYQDLDFHDRRSSVLEALVAQFNFLKSSDTEYRERILGTREFYDYLEVFKTYFWWKPGSYTAEFGVNSPNRAVLRPGRFSFSLSQHQVDSLRRNVENMRTDVENLVKADLPDYLPQEVHWNWSNVPLVPSKLTPVVRPQ